MLGAPGKGYIYNGGATALLGRLIDATGHDCNSFAKMALFGAVAIGTSEWATGTDGIASAASGIRS